MLRYLKSLLPMFVLSMVFVACGGSDDDDANTSASVDTNANRNVVTTGMPEEITRLEFPKVKGGSSIVLVHYADVPNSSETVNYTVEWDGEKKANRWTCYQMFASNRVSKTSRYYPTDGNGNYDRNSQYPQDPDLPSAYAWESGENDPYWGTGYNHGHICPSADRLYSYDANYQTFYLTNMSPQIYDFNAGVWETMESQLRSWISVSSSTSDTLYVCKGGTIDDDDQILETLSSGLVVPKYFFCALLMKNSGGYKALGFWFEHKADKSTNLSDYVVNIDTLEELTGLDFFCNLPDETENHVEGLAVANVLRAWGLSN